MDFLKKHYEKILLGVVLLAFLAAVGYLPFKIGADKQALDAKRESLIPKAVKPLPELDMTNSLAVLTRVSEPIIVNFSEPNKLFNSMPWQEKSDKALVLATSVGASRTSWRYGTPQADRLSSPAT